MGMIYRKEEEDAHNQAVDGKSKTIFRIETLSEEINPEWTLIFRRIFKDRLVSYLEEQEKTKLGLLFQGETTFWLQHSAMQATLFVPLASHDEKIRDIIVHLLKLHFEFINANYSSLKQSAIL